MSKMKFLFRKREENTTELDSSDIWIVKWVAMSLDCSFNSDGTDWAPSTVFKHRAFTNKEHADLFERELKAAFKLTGCSRYNVKLYKEESFTNI